MSRSRRPQKREKVLEPGCLLCDPEAYRQAARELVERDEEKFVRKNIDEDLIDHEEEKK